MSYNPFLAFVADKNGEYTKARFMALAEQLYREGRNKNRVLYSMMSAAFTLAGDQRCPQDFLDFLAWVRDHAESFRVEVEAVVDERFESDEARAVDQAS